MPMNTVTTIIARAAVNRVIVRWNFIGMGYRYLSIIFK
jgi:hypothetical protein